VVTAAPTLNARSLTLRYGTGPLVLEAVDLDLRAGELVAVVGLNGAGKSTLLRALAGLLRPSAGEVRLDGRDVQALSGMQRARRIAYVPQALAALPPVTVERFVLNGRYAHLGLLRLPTAADRAIARDALAATDVVQHAGRPLAELSGGERQRTLVARALAQQADVLLCDEPVSAFDLPHQLGLLDLLADLAARGRIVVLTTHDLNLASQYADRVAVLHERGIAACGPPRQALQRAVVERVWGERLRVVDDARAAPTFLSAAGRPPHSGCAAPCAPAARCRRHWRGCRSSSCRCRGSARRP
jgi:iron complex transport system ATP-binding protein